MVEVADGAVVCVVWTDAYFELDDDNDHDDYTVCTYGIYQGTHGPFTRIAGGITPDGCRAVTHIPTVLIQRTIVYG